MSLDFLKNLLKSTKKDIIHKAAVEKIVDMAFKALKNETIPSFVEISKMKEEAFNRTAIERLYPVLNSKKGIDQAKALIVVANILLSNEQNIKDIIKKLPEHMPLKYVTTLNASIISLATVVCNFVLSSVDVAIALTSNSDVDFSAAVNTEVSGSVTSYLNTIPYVRNIKVIIEATSKSDDEVNILEDNVRLEALLKAKGGLPDIPNLNFAFIGRISYTIGTWLADREYQKFEALKVKKNYLLKRILEIDNMISNNPEDSKLKTAKEVYMSEVEKLTFKLRKMENG